MTSRWRGGERLERDLVYVHVPEYIRVDILLGATAGTSIVDCGEGEARYVSELPDCAWVELSR